MPRQTLFSMDLIMDLGMLLISQLALGQFRPIRLLAAAFFLFACTIYLPVSELPSFCVVPAHLCVFLTSAWIATAQRRPARILEATACMFCTGAAAAGFISLGHTAALPAALAGSCLLLFLLRRHRHESHRWNIEVYVEKDGLSASFPALIDTGNRLREHRSGLPVLIVEAGALSRIAEYISSLPSGQVRVLPFGVLGSTGEITCFQPDKIEIILPLRGNIPAPPCWVAVFPGKIPGSIRALAPPVFTNVLESRFSIFQRNSEIE